MLVEAVQVVLPSLAVVSPHAALVTREGLGEVGVGGAFVHPHVPVPIGGRRVGPRRLEPRVLVGRVVHHQVDDDPHAPVVGGAHDLDELSEGTQPGIDAVEVADVVAVILVGRRVEGHEPQRGHADSRQIVDPIDQPGEVAHAIAVPIEERLRVEAVHDPVLPPLVTGERDAHGSDTSGSTSAP